VSRVKSSPVVVVQPPTRRKGAQVDRNQSAIRSCFRNDRGDLSQPRAADAKRMLQSVNKEPIWKAFRERI
jgi:hypothetical protein